MTTETTAAKRGFHFKDITKMFGGGGTSTLRQFGILGSLIVISSELPELLGITDRIYTVFEGRVTDCIPADQATPEDLMRSMTSTNQKASA